MADVYAGGIPNQGFNGTFPSTASTGEMFKPDPTNGEVDTEAGGPATFSGSSDPGIINGEAYEGPGDMDPGTMKIVDLNDIKSTV